MLTAALLVVCPSVFLPRDHLGCCAVNLLQFVYVFLELSCRKAQLGSYPGSLPCLEDSQFCSGLCQETQLQTTSLQFPMKPFFAGSEQTCLVFLASNCLAVVLESL